MPQLVLYEYGSVQVPLSRRHAELLNASGAVTVTPSVGADWTVTASSFVGSLAVGGVELLIRPKIKPENLFLLLEPGLPEHAWRDEAVAYETTGDLLPSVVAFFARTVDTTLGRGVLRAYRTQHERIIAMRGRLDLAAQFRRPGVASPIACEFDEYTEDNAENRYLRAGLRVALRVPRVHPIDRRRLTLQLAALEGVADVGMSPDALDRIPFTRMNAHYRPALNLARLLLANATLVDARGGTSAPSFLVDMNDLFQRFVTERLRRALRGRLRVHDEPTVHLAERRQVSMKPDLVFRDHRGRDVHVGDLKYKIAADARARSGDYYQLLAYTTALDLPEGILIYCLANGGRPERTVVVKHAGKRLRFFGIDLSGSVASVNSQIDELATAIAGARHV